MSETSVMSMAPAGVWNDGERQRRKRKQNYAEILQSTYRVLVRNHWSLQSAQQVLKVGESALRARIRSLRRDPKYRKAVPAKLTEKNPAQAQQRLTARISDEEVIAFHQRWRNNGWDLKKSLAEVGKTYDQFFGIRSKMRILQLPFPEGVSPSRPYVAAVSAPGVKNPERIREVLEAVFDQPGAVDIPDQGRGIPTQLSVELDRRRLPELLKINYKRSCQLVRQAFLFLRENWRKEVESPDPEVRALLHLASRIRHDTGNHTTFEAFLEHVVTLCQTKQIIDPRELVAARARKSRR